jgi:NAD(P)H-dependent flavin oxidoreductase YrpB (nitropropane dioxygenase family)
MYGILHMKNIFMETELTKLLKIKYPIMCAGMGFSVTTPELAAAVSNAGGIGTLAFIGFSPEGMRKSLKDLKSRLKPGVPYGVDLVFPADPSKNPRARKTNAEYLKNDLNEVVQVLLDERVPLLVCAIGVPERWVTDALHKNGTVIMNMVGHPKHVPKAVSAGVDIICCQGGEGGGHTGSIASTILIPMCVDAVKGKTNYFGSPILIVAAGGIFDGRGLASALSYGASGVWMGTRFLMTHEANAETPYKETLLNSDIDSTTRSVVYSGRPMRVINSPYVSEWAKKEAEADSLIKQGVPPAKSDVKSGKYKAELFKGLNGDDDGFEFVRKDSRTANAVFDPRVSPMPVGQAVGAIHKLEHAADLVPRIAKEAAASMRRTARILGESKL